MRDLSGRKKGWKLWGPTSYGFFCLSFVFLCLSFLFPLSIPLSSVDFHTFVNFICGDASAPLIGFLLLRMAPILKEGLKTGVMDFLVVGLS